MQFHLLLLLNGFFINFEAALKRTEKTKKLKKGGEERFLLPYIRFLSAGLLSACWEHS